MTTNRIKISILVIDSSSESCETLDDDEEKENEVDDDEVLIFDETNAGTSITVDNNGRKASRDIDSFCNGVVFSKVLVLIWYSAHINVPSDIIEGGSDVQRGGHMWRRLVRIIEAWGDQHTWTPEAVSSTQVRLS